MALTSRTWRASRGLGERFVRSASARLGRRDVGSMFPEFPDMSSLTDKRREFAEERILGYSPEKVYDIVADLDRYKEFLPWCHESHYIRKRQERSCGQLSIGFPPLLERYTAMVLHSRPDALRTIATDGTLFTSLENHWQFRPGPIMDSGPTCLLNFWVMFEFRTIIYARLGNLVFDEVARTMAASFEQRCEEVYGPSHLTDRKGRSRRNKPHPSRTIN